MQTHLPRPRWKIDVLHLALGVIGMLVVGLHPAGANAQSVLQHPVGAFIAGGSVAVSAVQADGKIVIGGHFFAVGGVPRNNLARLNSDGSVDLSWAPNVNNGFALYGPITSLAVHGNTVYVGGQFSTLGGAQRAGLGAVDAVSGLATPWNPAPNGAVNAIDVANDGSVVFVGGQFSVIGGAARTYLAAVSASDGTALANWDAHANSSINSLAINDTTLFVGGSMFSIGGAARSYLAALNLGDASATSWDPEPSAPINTLTLSGSTLYVGTANLSTVAGVSRSNAFALDIGSGLATAWHPSINFDVRSIAVVDGGILIGGAGSYLMPFSPPGYLFSVDATTGAAQSWHPSPDDVVDCISVVGSHVFAGGEFKHINGVLTGGLADVDVATAVVSPQQLSNTSGTVAAIASQADGKVILGGQFTAIDNVPRNNIVRLNHDGSIDTTWNPGSTIDGTISGLSVTNNLAYVAGDFYNIGGHYRQRLAAIDLGTGVATSWQPDPDGAVRSIAIIGQVVYVAGDFMHVGDAPALYLAALDATSGAALPFALAPNGPVSVFATLGNTLYVGGYFDHVGDSPRNNLAAIDSATQTLLPWDPSPNGGVSAFASTATALYVAGQFQTIGGTARINLAALDSADGAVLPWAPPTSGSSGNWNVRCLQVAGNDIAIGGYMQNAAQTESTALMLVDRISGTSDASTGPQILDKTYLYGGELNAIAYTGDELWLVGKFDSVDNQVRSGLAAVHLTDTVFGNGFELPSMQ